MSEDKWIRMSLEDLKTPKPGRICYGPAYWLVEDGQVKFFKGYGSPQCNMHESIMRRLHPEGELVFLEVAFVPHRCSDYV
jgi:hypothetical protein